MVIGDLYQIAKDVIGYFRERDVETVGEKEFMRMFEKRIGKKLSAGGKAEIIRTLYDRGKITRSKTRNGRRIIIFNPNDMATLQTD